MLRTVFRTLTLALALPLVAQAQPAESEGTAQAASGPRLQVLVIVETEDPRVKPAALREAVAAADVLAFGLDDPRAAAADATVTVVVASGGQSARVLFVPEAGSRTVRQLSATGEADPEGRWMATAIAQLVRAYEERLRGERPLVLTDLVDPWYVVDPAEVRVERVPETEVIDPWRGTSAPATPRLVARMTVTTELLDPWREGAMPPLPTGGTARGTTLDPWAGDGEGGRELGAPRPSP